MDIKDNKFAQKYKKTLEGRSAARALDAAKSGSVPKSMRRKKYKVGSSDEYSPKFVRAFTEAVGMYNKSHPK